MYDFPEIEGETDTVWEVLRGACMAAELPAPERLDRAEKPEVLWRAPGLVLAQTCGYPLVYELADQVALVGTPHYAAEGCVDALYSSAIIVASGDTARDLSALRGCVVAVNGLSSQSGCNALRAKLSPLAASRAFVSSVYLSGSHRASVCAVADGRARFAAIDAVSWAVLRRIEPAAARVRVLDWTDHAPALPLITSCAWGAARRERLSDEIAEVLVRSTRPALSFGGVAITGFSQTRMSDYRRIAQMRAMADRMPSWNDGELNKE